MPAAVRRRRIPVVAAAVGRRRVALAMVWRRRVPIMASVCGDASVMVLLGVDDLFEFASIEEDAAAILALLDVDAVTVEGPHAALALGASHGRQHK
jgi:hypothetical protein